MVYFKAARGAAHPWINLAYLLEKGQSSGKGNGNMHHAWLLPSLLASKLHATSTCQTISGHGHRRISFFLALSQLIYLRTSRKMMVQSFVGSDAHGICVTETRVKSSTVLMLEVFF